ncbi:BF3164 family lipoprotein [Bacteroides muris (ex Afrizal et al. 2022)]|jgi:hypothetical protein|uniref:DUF4221 domain-containing protein n=2 Tax=Bacteroides TaxID=816 RepID=A0A4S2B129_9BACE|nr:BF3164 family lipoprotein [Bacteroides muris (ex Afrizal et al. 2022)]TGY07172.1 hypothetical protein E5355_06980 [Bacteroides muris (ex Afrizal et al. 2022)]
MKRTFPFLLLVLILTGALTMSCSRRTSDGTTTFYLEGVAVPTDSLQNGYAVIDADANEIIIEVSKEQHFFETYRLTADSACLTQRYGARGAGPTELAEAHLIYYHKPTRNMLLYSGNDMGAQLINLNTKAVYPVTAFRQNASLWLMKADFVNDSIVLVACVIPNPKNKRQDWFKLLHLPTGRLTDVAGFFPADGFDSPMMTKQWIYNSSARLKKHPTRNRFLYGCGDEGLYAEIFDLEDNRVINRKVMLDQYPTYQPGEDGISPEGAPDWQLTGFKVSVTSRYIYLLLSRESHGERRAITRGQTPDKFKGPGKRTAFSEEILVFDWEGRLCHKLHLNPFVVNIAVTEDDSLIYGITESEAYEPVLMRYPHIF